MGLPLSRLPEPDSEVAHLIPFPDDEPDRSPIDFDTWWGYLILALTGLACVAGAYCTSYLAEYWPETTTGILVTVSATSIGVIVLVMRKGYGDPWFRKHRRWLHRYEDWRFQALQAMADHRKALCESEKVDEAACAFFGVDDPAEAHKLLLEHLKRMKVVKRTGRPRHSPTGLSREKWLEIAHDIRRRRDKGTMTWDDIGRRHNISGDTASKWYRWLEEEERGEVG